MKFPETKTRSPFYKMLSPLVEKAPMVPFISSFLRRRPGPRLFVQMGLQGTLPRTRDWGRLGCVLCAVCRQSQSPAIRSRGAAPKEGEAGLGALRQDEWTGIVPQEAGQPRGNGVEQVSQVLGASTRPARPRGSTPLPFQLVLLRLCRRLVLPCPLPRCYVLPDSVRALLRKPPLASVQTA